MDLFDNFEVKAELPFRLPQENGYSYIWSDAHCGFYIKLPGGELFYSQNFFSKKISDRCVEYFLENETLDWRLADWKSIQDIKSIEFCNIEWSQESISIYGKERLLPRLTSWYGDTDKEYSYSGLKLRPNLWNEGLFYLKKEIEERLELCFNSVLLNWYRDGEDYLNWHSDDERELGLRPTIASANFGASRDFALRRKGHNDEKIIIPLCHGSLLVMSGDIQNYWEHSVPKRKKVRKSRFNLTFRYIYE